MLKPMAWLSGVLLMSTISWALAHDTQTDAMRIAHPFALPTPPGASNGAAYVDITASSSPVTLISASSPASSSVELHTMHMEGDMMKMRHVSELRIEAGDTTIMRPGGGYHLMLIGLNEPLKEGERFPLTLTFADGEEINVDVWVQNAKEGREAADSHHNH